jgi:hypothetical protein
LPGKTTGAVGAGSAGRLVQPAARTTIMTATTPNLIVKTLLRLLSTIG